MRHQTLREAQQALASALRDLEATRMTRNDDPELSALKDAIRRLVPPIQPETEPSPAQ